VCNEAHIKNNNDHAEYYTAGPFLARLSCLSDERAYLAYLMLVPIL